MFNPKNLNKKKTENAAKKKAINDIKSWSLTCIPAELQEGLIIDVNEVICGDPSCAPVDTVFTMVWESGGKGVFALPLSPVEVTADELRDNFPDVDTLIKWKSGKKAPWPKLPDLRLKVGDRVECRIGPHPVKGWAPGRIIRLYYSEPNWPPSMFAPYQIALHDGRLIFAPQDTDQVIRLRPPAAPDAPSSPDYMPMEIEGEDDDDDDDEEEEQYEEDANQQSMSSANSNNSKKG